MQPSTSSSLTEVEAPRALPETLDLVRRRPGHLGLLMLLYPLRPGATNWAGPAPQGFVSMSHGSIGVFHHALVWPAKRKARRRDRSHFPSQNSLPVPGEELRPSCVYAYTGP
ncbi:hypothetical protein ACRAWF_46585 [Streptomyces sp. L7]